MSLKWFHVVFVGASIVLAVWFGVWLMGRSAAGAAAAFLTAAALIAYLVFFRRKAEREHL